MPQTQAEFISISHQRRGGRNSFQSRRRRDEPLRLLVIFSLMFFVFSCAKDQQESDAIIHSATNLPVTSYSESESKLEGLEVVDNDLLREGCHCYMQILYAENIINTTAPDVEYDWGLVDATDPNSGNLEIDGRGIDMYREDAGQDWQMLPTPFIELDEPSFGTHMFYMIFIPISSSELNPPSDFTIYTRIRCVNKTSEGYDAPSEMRYKYAFHWKDGGPVFGDASARFKPFWLDFTCPEGENIDNF